MSIKKIVEYIEIENPDVLQHLLGNLDENLFRIEHALNVRIRVEDNAVVVSGEENSVFLTKELFRNLGQWIESQGKLDLQSLNYTMDMVLKGNKKVVDELINEVICITSEGKSIKPKTLGQKRYIDSIKQNDIVFGIGPAGTGKTYLAMAMAVRKFKNKEVSRIILTRPAVEAGENLGFLPGDLQDKVDPYLRPIYDALFDILGVDSFSRMLEKGIIEVAPLAYMRGRTLDSCFVILDEAQNTTREQMKMFLTRLGFGSKAIITGDVTQIDLSRGRESGLISIQSILKQIEGIDFIYFDKHDVVRHPLIQKIIEAYENFDKKVRE